jgi:hypothetical protein
MLYDMIWYIIIWYDTIWYMTWYDMIWYDMILYYMIWYDMIWYYIILYDIWYLLLFNPLFRLTPVLPEFRERELRWYTRIWCMLILILYTIWYDMIRDIIWFCTYYMIYDIWHDDIWYDMIYLLKLGGYPVALVQYTFTHKQYTEQHSDTEYAEYNTNNNKKIHSLHN